MAAFTLILVLLFSAGCEGPLDSEKPGKFTWVAESLDGHKNNFPEDAVPLEVNLESENDWMDLLAVISYKNVYVALDISKSTFAGLTAFDPGTFRTGKRYIVELILPDKSTGIVGGSREWPAFRYFSYLSEISGKNIETLGSYLFSGTVLEEIDFPALTFIDSYAFYNCRYLESVTIPESMDRINEGTFENSRISEAVIPSGVKSIGASAFSGCGYLTSVTIPDSVKSIGKEAFARCSRLESITIPAGVESIEEGVFKASGLTGINIPNSVKTIASFAFDNCSKLESITIPAGVESIEEGVFRTCGFTEITIPESVTSIGSFAFYYCTKLENVIIPDNVTSIGNFAFANCQGLESIKIPESVISIGDSAFEYCTALTGITIPDSVTSIGKAAFRNCTWLASVNIPDGVSAIEDFTFQGCAFSGIIIPGSVTVIGTGAFRGSRLESVIIPSGVTSIGEYAFFGCRNLAAVEFNAAIGEDNFFSDSFSGDLYEKYLAGGTGTYTTENPGNSAVWIKQ